jgi:signal transduction histidine kinase
MQDDPVRLRELAAPVQKLLRVQHEERVRIADWLHEQVMQDLFVARFNLEFSMEDFSPEQVAGVHKDLLQIIQQMRGLSYDLYSRVVNVSHLAEMLQDCAEKGENDWAMSVAFQANSGSEGV